MNKSFVRAVFACCLGIVLVPKSAFSFGACQSVFPRKGISYLPEVAACGGNAGVVVYGDYLKSFSVVVRDCNNNDRDPCNYSASSCASNESSPFKAQTIVNVTVKDPLRNRSVAGRLFCFQEKGSSAVFKLVRRITIKRKNPVKKPSDVVKLCLKTRTKSVRGVSILTVGSAKDVSQTGYSSRCASQPYLSCSIAYKDICPY